MRKTGLECISTAWTLLRQAHAANPGGNDDHRIRAAAARDAQALLIERYRRAVHRYLLGAVKDSDQAEELFQEFAFRFVRGDFRNAAPSAGRFRDYLRASLSHMINEHRRARRKWPGPLPDDAQAPSPETSADPFLAAWRGEVIDQAWEGLREENAAQYAVLDYFARHNDAVAATAAAAISQHLGRALTPTNVRVILHRARQRLAELIMAEVAATMHVPSQDELAEELRALNLLKLCGPALAERYVATTTHAAGD